MKNSLKFRIFKTSQYLAEKFAAEMVSDIETVIRERGEFSLALSGGSTPRTLFSVLAEKYSLAAFWEKVSIYWVDERCVPPDDPESNFGMTRKILLEKINIPGTAIHRIKGEEDPAKETRRYSNEIISSVRNDGRLPVFDLIILGMGEDGHTASIFPGNLALVSADTICEAAVHPVSGQKRITLTGKVINNADKLAFLVTGSGKSGIIKEIFDKKADYLKYPAAHIRPFKGEVSWYLDKQAAALIS